MDWKDPKWAARMEADYKRPEVIHQRAEIISMLQPAAGQRILDVGCGPGFLLRDILEAAPGANVEGLDLSDTMLGMAKDKLSAMPKHQGAWNLLAGGAESLPFPDNMFDGVVICQVLLHVPDVPRALAEVQRVLKPGGCLVICDTDMDSFIVHTADPERFSRVCDALKARVRDPHGPRKFPELLAKAGLELEKFGTVNMGAAGAPSEESFIHSWIFNLLVENTKDSLPQGDIDGWVQEQRALIAEKAFFVSLHRSLFRARKPA